MCRLLLQKWLILREIVYILQIPLRATIELQQEDLTLSDVYGIWTKMRLHLNACASKTNYKTSLVKYLVEALLMRQENIFSNPYMIAALFLDPRFRHQIISNESKVEEAKRLLSDLWRRIAYCIERTELERQKDSPNVSFEFDAEADLDNYLTGRCTRPTNELEYNFDIESALELFQPPQIPANSSILNYWHATKNEHPQLYELAMIVYAVPPTEVKIERDFLLLNHVYSKRRGQLNLDRLADIMMINLNSGTFHIVKEKELKEMFESIEIQES